MARWSFRYGGQLTDGEVLKRREVAPILSDGRAWGAAVAAYHANHTALGMTGAVLRASEAMSLSYTADRAQMLEAGWIPNLDSTVDQRNRLDEILAHYVSTVEPFPNLTRIEGELRVPIWSRTGGRSNRYQFVCHIDGWTVDYLNSNWLVEFKLRGDLYDADMIELSRQPRWYAWALRELQRQQGLDRELVGAIVDERWNVAPGRPLILKSGKPSHDKRQRITEEAYRQVCADLDDEPTPTMISALRERRWQQRVPIPFRPSELDEAGIELVSAAKLIRDLDAGELFPIRNARPGNCRTCEFRKICPNPSDRLLVDTQFLRRPPKRERALEPAA